MADSDKTTPTAEKVRQATQAAVLKTELNHIKESLQRIETSPPIHQCSQVGRITEIEKEQAGILSSRKLSMMWQVPLVLAVLGMAVTGLQVCSSHEASIAEARTERHSQESALKSQDTNLKRLETVQREDTTRVLGAIQELRIELQAEREAKTSDRRGRNR